MASSPSVCSGRLAEDLKSVCEFWKVWLRSSRRSQEVNHLALSELQYSLTQNPTMVRHKRRRQGKKDAKDLFTSGP